MGPLLRKEGYSLYWPGSTDAPIVPDYYQSEYKSADSSASLSSSDGVVKKHQKVADPAEIQKGEAHDVPAGETNDDKREQPAHAKELAKVDELPWAHPRRIWATVKLVLTYGITRDVIKHQSKGLEDGKLSASPIFHFYSSTPSFFPLTWRLVILWLEGAYQKQCTHAPSSTRTKSSTSGPQPKYAPQC